MTKDVNCYHPMDPNPNPNPNSTSPMVCESKLSPELLKG